MGTAELEVTSETRFVGAEAVGAPGPYRLLRGVLHFAFDSTTPAARRIADLERAETGRDGLVHAAADVQLLSPVDPNDGNGGLVYVVANRGNAGELPFASHSAMPDPMASVSATDGFLLRQGWTVLWSGWQWDVARVGWAVGLDAPLVAAGGAGMVRVVFRAATDSRSHALDESAIGIVMPPAPASYPASLDNDAATLVVHDLVHDDGAVVPRERWCFGRDDDGRIVDDPSAVWLADGFEEGRVYEVRYRTDRAPVVGCGLLAVRDAVAHVRYSPVSPVADRVKRVLALGVSQSGRFLRQFLHDGMNLDDAGRPVFDGMLVHVAGSRRGEFNHRYAVPGETWTMGDGSRPPYSTADLLDRQHRLAGGGLPKVVCTNSSFEYWRGDAALCHFDPGSGVDLADGPGTRHYLFAGSDHVGALPIGRLLPLEHPPTEVATDALLRAAFDNLDRWVADGVEPPASCVPRLGDGTAATRQTVLGQFAGRGVAIPDLEALHPAAIDERFPALVAAVDEDGNEVAGVRTPEVAVPVAALTGWNAFKVPRGRARMAPEFVGSAIAFAAARLAERYPDREAVEHRARAAAQALLRARLLLVDDVEEVVSAALRRYDAVT